ncbi:MAG: type IX secretion system protein PorQ [Chlorobiales bacterium]
MILTRLVRFSFCIFFILLGVSERVSAQTAVYEFLRLDRSARVAGLGGNSVSLKGDVVGLFQNPASISSETDKSASFSFQKNLMDINAGFIAYGREIKGIGDFGIGLSYINYGTFTRADVAGNTGGEFTAGDLCFQLGYGREIEQYSFGTLRAGVGLKYVFSNIAEFSSSGVAFDAGLLLDIPDEKLQIGLSILNVGRQISTYDGISETLPLDVRIGATTQLEGLPLILSIGFINLADKTDNALDKLKFFTVGGEFLLSEAVRLRAGYNNKLRDDLSVGGALGLSGVSGGLGLEFNKFKFDYAFSSLGVIGIQHQLSVATIL